MSNIEHNSRVRQCDGGKTERTDKALALPTDKQIHKLFKTFFVKIITSGRAPKTSSAIADGF